MLVDAQGLSSAVAVFLDITQHMPCKLGSVLFNTYHRLSRKYVVGYSCSFSASMVNEMLHTFGSVSVRIYVCYEQTSYYSLWVASSWSFGHP